MTDATQINDLVHKELLPIRQMFISYSELAHNPSVRVDPKIFKKCANKVQQLIDIARELTV